MSVEDGPPDIAAQQAWLDRLTRQEVEAAMAECDRLGLDAFLRQGGFIRPQVWVKGATGDRAYPAKATVAAALGHLPEGRALSVKDFFNGFGEQPSFARLKDLGYEVQGKGGDTPGRAEVEAAMDAFDAYRARGDHAQVFAAFGDPRDYWVRSTRARPNRVYPTKPLVGHILGKTVLNGGWTKRTDAAAWLHNAGFIIVDQDDVPVAPPDKSYLTRGAERIRLCALNYFIEPARERGEPDVSIRASDLAAAMGLEDAFPNICQALGGVKFQHLAQVPPPSHTGPNPGSTTIFTYQLGSREADPVTDIPMPTNLILHGPPGTGKTWSTAWEAVRLCLGAAALPLEHDRPALMAEYRRLVAEGRVEFVTFHQSMAYEEFVEGLRPETGDGPAGGFRLAPHDGVFKRASERARWAGLGTTSGTLDPGRRVFKMSLGDTTKPEGDLVFGDCIRDGKVLMGFDLGIDWSDDIYGDPAEILARTRQVAGHEAASPDSGLVSFHHTLRNVMETGDIVLVSRGLRKLRAIGVVTGPYGFDAARADHFRHGRPVDWLWVSPGPQSDIDTGRFYPNDFSRQTLYMLQKPVDWQFLLAATGLDKGQGGGSPPPHVLIIDEINRANISKVFGELITLLEPDKRLGMENEIRLTLPYSRERFGVPANLHIIGTMNTADRSIALLDTALRRRFDFRELMPDPEVLSTDLDGIDLRKLLATINDRIEYLFDREHRIGHAYFTACKTRADVEAVMRHRIIPLLAEYFHEDWSRVAAVLGDMGQAPPRFLLREEIAAPAGMEADPFAAPRHRWRVGDSFDFSEFAA